MSDKRHVLIVMDNQKIVGAIYRDDLPKEKLICPPMCSPFGLKDSFCFQKPAVELCVEKPIGPFHRREE